MTSILGISAFYHDSAAALLVDGRIVAAAQEERFTRKRHDAAFPNHAIDHCLQTAGLTAADLDFVTFYDKPILKFDRLLETYLAFAPRGFAAFRKAIPVWLKDKLFTRQKIKSELPGATRATLAFTEHHESHAASAFFPSPFPEAAILTMDGVGEWDTTTRGYGSGNKIHLTDSIQFPHSLGLLYSAFTYYCGFKVNSGEYKLMGLAPYGRPIYRDRILKHLIELRDDGSYWLDMSYFGYCDGLTMTNDRFDDLFGGPARSPEHPLEQRHMDLAASIQQVTEEAVMACARHLHAVHPSDNLVLAGGVALNCVANGRLLREGPFKHIWIQPAAGDAGGALGAAMFTWHQLLDEPRVCTGTDFQRGSFLGPEFDDASIAKALTSRKVPFSAFASDDELYASAVSLLASEKVVGWFQGGMEFGPRALGARSILGDPRSPGMQAVMNLQIKYRESFRPFAPAVLAEHQSEWFDLDGDQDHPYMLIVAPIREDRRVAISAEDERAMRTDPDLFRRVNVPRSQIPAVTHVDYSARVQTVGAEAVPRFRGLLTAFHAATRCPALVNTSFNVRGEPIVCTPEDALLCFASTGMDAVILGNCIVTADAKPRILASFSTADHVARFEAD